jgi:hypothetical protein
MRLVGSGKFTSNHAGKDKALFDRVQASFARGRRRMIDRRLDQAIAPKTRTKNYGPTMSRR